MIFSLFALLLVDPINGQINDEVDYSDLTLEELFSIDIDSVIGASRYEQKISEAPSTISVITREEIQRYNYNTLIESLNSLHGFYQSYDRNYSYLGVRGFGRPADYNSRVLLLVDGHRTNENIYDASVLGTDAILDLQLIERVEVVRGPSSSVYGSNAFFGAINIITRTPASIGGIETSAEIASHDTYRLRVTYGDEFENGLGILLSASILDSNGPGRLYYPEYDDESSNFGIAENVDDDQSKQAYAKFLYKGITLTGAYVKRDKGIPTASFGSVFNDKKNHTWDEISFLNMAYDKTLDNDLKVQVSASYNQYDYYGDFIYDWSDEGDLSYLVTNKDFAYGKWWNASAHINGNFMEDRLSVVGGIEYRKNTDQNQRNFDDDSGDIYMYLDSQKKSEISSVYTQMDFKFNDEIRLSSGVRHDDYNTFGGTTNPRLGFIYQPAEDSTVKLLYGTAFRAPNAFELYYHDDGGQKANPWLKPEKIETLEFAFEHKFNEQYYGSISVFNYSIDGLISAEVDPIDELVVFGNLDEVNSKGVEIEFRANLENGLLGRASYSWQETKDATTQEILSNSPKHLIKLNVSGPIYKDSTFAGIELQYNSSRMTLGGGESGDFWLLNSTLFSRELAEGIDFTATVYNVFDTQYSFPGGPEHSQDVIEQNGRTFSAKLTIRF